MHIKIVLNPTKSTAVIFTLHRPKDYNTLKINGQNIEWSHNIKKLTLNCHISTKLQQRYQRLKILYLLVNQQT